MSYLIEDIEEQSLVAEMNVINALMASYVKEATMLEYTTKEVVEECFYQEGEKWDKFKQDANAPVFGNKGEKLLKRILMFIPRLITAIIKKLKKFKKSNQHEIGSVNNENPVNNQNDLQTLINNRLASLNDFARDNNLNKQHIDAIRTVIEFAIKEGDCRIVQYDDYLEKMQNFMDKGDKVVEELEKIKGVKFYDEQNLQLVRQLNSKLNAILGSESLIPEHFTYFPITCKTAKRPDNEFEQKWLESIDRSNAMLDYIEPFSDALNNSVSNYQDNSEITQLLLNIARCINTYVVDMYRVIHAVNELEDLMVEISAYQKYRDNHQAMKAEKEAGIWIDDND